MFFRDEPAPPDTRLVLEAASLLETTEFNIFELAYFDWYGRRPGEAEIEPVYVTYMFEYRIPCWVRLFSRKVKEVAARGGLDRAEYGLPFRFTSLASKKRGVAYALFLVGFFTFLLALAQNTVDLAPWMRDCHFPPCY